MPFIIRDFAFKNIIGTFSFRIICINLQCAILVKKEKRRNRERERETEEWKIVLEDSNISWKVFQKIFIFPPHFTLCYHPPKILFSNRVSPVKSREMQGGYKGYEIQLSKRTSSIFISTVLILAHSPP
jgi:hypothetical protein